MKSRTFLAITPLWFESKTLHCNNLSLADFSRFHLSPATYSEVPAQATNKEEVLSRFHRTQLDKPSQPWPIYNVSDRFMSIPYGIAGALMLTGLVFTAWFLLYPAGGGSTLAPVTGILIDASGTRIGADTKLRINIQYDPVGCEDSKDRNKPALELLADSTEIANKLVNKLASKRVYIWMEQVIASGAVAERTPRYISGRNSHLVGCSVRILKLHGWRKNKQTSKHTNRQTCKHVCMSIRFAGPVRCLLPPLSLGGSSFFVSQQREGEGDPG